MLKTILIVDDDPTQRRLLEAVLQRQGFQAITCDSGRRALQLLAGNGAIDYDLVLLDWVMPEVDGAAVLAEICPARPELPFIVLTGQGDLATVVKAMRAGATDFIVKPVSPERLQVSINNALKINALSGEVSRLKRRWAGRLGFADIVGSSEQLQRAMDMARRAAGSSIPVLIDGESGVGKEMFALAVQGASERAGKPFITVNCGAIPDNLVESILFGHEKGSFTGASDRHIGKFQEADGGTLFLDEVGELRLDMQVKLLRAIQEGEIDPIGSRAPVKVNIRLISATNRDLAQLVRDGKFREDLYYRLSVFPVRVPPLRDRREDIALLVDHFVGRIAASEGKLIRGVTPEAMQLLTHYPWPGNVRQLENSIFRAIVLAEGEMLTAQDFPTIAGAPHGQADTAPVSAQSATSAPRDSGMTPPLPDWVMNDEAVRIIDEKGVMRPLSEVEADVIRLALERYHGRMSEIARRLGIGRSTLYRKVTELGLEDRIDQMRTSVG